MITQTIQKHLEANGIHTSIISPDLTTTRLHLHRNTYDLYRRRTYYSNPTTHYIAHDQASQTIKLSPDKHILSLSDPELLDKIIAWANPICNTSSKPSTKHSTKQDTKTATAKTPSSSSTN